MDSCSKLLKMELQKSSIGCSKLLNWNFKKHQEVVRGINLYGNKGNHTYRISTLPSKHRTPDQLHGLPSMGSQSWKTPWGSASTLTFSSSNASPNTQTGLNSHKSPNRIHRTRSPPMSCPRTKLRSAK